MEKVMICPVCDSNNLVLFIERISTPVHQNFIFKDYDKARNMVKGNINLAICKNCSFIFNYSFDLTKLNYSEFYDNTQTCSTYFQSYVDGIIHFLIENYNIIGKNIVEVGCGKGDFLKKIVEASKGKGYGFDPSYVGPEVILDGRVIFNKQFYNRECSDIYADIVICRHVIEHEADPVNLLLAIRSALSNSPKAFVFFETPNVEWILKNKIVYDIFYEHCSYFCVDSIAYLFKRCGFKIEEVKHAFNGQYMWVIATIDNHPHDLEKNNTDTLISIAHEFRETEKRIWLRWNDIVKECKGNVAVWGAGAKGVTLLNVIDPNAEKVKYVIDINPKKAGGYLPGTGHKVIGYKDIAGQSITDIIVLNSNYIQEIQESLSQENISVHLINGEELLLN